MEVLTASTTHLLSTLNKLTDHSFFHTLPQSLPVSPCIITSPTQVALPDSFYFSLFFIFGGGLYILLLLPFTLRQKQWMAAPLVAGLFAFPLIFTSTNSPVLQLAHLGACGCVLMRQIDLYYVRPWRTGKEPTMNWEDWYTEAWQPFRKVPMSKEQLQRFELELQQTRIRREIERQEQDALHNGASSSGNKDKDAKTAAEPATDTPKKETAKPMKGKPVKQIYTPRVDANPQHWSAYLPRWFFYAILMDVIPFIMSFITFEHIQNFNIVQTFLLRIGVAAMVIFDISLLNYTIMILCAAVTGDLIHDTEWTLVRHYFPGFATSPAEFWRQWHHLFKYIWVDLGFHPVLHILRKYVTPKSKNRQLTSTLEMVLPVMGVFLMSGLMHEYMMVGMWHITPGHMTLFFLIQGAGTILSKVLLNTVGKKVHVPPIVLIALTWIFNLTTASLFMEPVLKNHGYNMVANQSLLLHSYNLLRSHGIF
ncbi:hypothetical protein BGZ95_003933 [Linnemannia exigua]|uniref:Wax synthase domain-containing protein n=1 Tax=Linnemannia exigua TaxID=604196 RepID=A0AAD4DHN1_9FUNG|nr:hypothetical protein BGZ95_003933 [Linnemannia exigua]